MDLTGKTPEQIADILTRAFAEKNGRRGQIKMTSRDLYLIGASAFLLADLLSDGDIMKVLRGLKKKAEIAYSVPLLKPFKNDEETLKNLKNLSQASLIGSKIYGQVHKYTRTVEAGNFIEGEKTRRATSDELKQFADSSEYLESWLNVLFETPEEKVVEMNDAIDRAIKEVNGKRKNPFTELLEWLGKQPESVSRDTVRNKAIELKNRA